jgi:hypothetical protein
MVVILGRLVQRPFFYAMMLIMKQQLFESFDLDLPNYCLEKEFPKFEKGRKDLFPLTVICPNCKNPVYKYNRKKLCHLNQGNNSDL